MDQPRIYCHRFESPIGSLHIAVNRHGAVLRIGMNNEYEWPKNTIVEENKYACGEVEYQLMEYFNGHRHSFELPLQLQGTKFQRAVWDKLRRLPYGSTITYGELALKVGNRWAARAVGGAVARNPVPIIIPCHRVVPASGGIGAYALRSIPDGSGAQLKQYLLDLELSASAEVVG
ncbi:MAG: methylated-DNA--[protein]-cysteine S-methyltransferase [Spirochaeta sp.]